MFNLLFKSIGEIKLKRLKGNNSGFVLVGSIMLVVFLGVMMAASFMRTDIQLKEAHMRLASQQAFFAAESGIERALSELRVDSLWRPQGLTSNLKDDNNKEDVGVYTLSVEDGSPSAEGFPTVWVKSIGKVQDKHLIYQAIQRALRVRIVLIDPSKFFISTAGHLTAGSGATIKDEVLTGTMEFAIDTTLPDSTDQQKEARTININADIKYLNKLSGDDPKTNPYIKLNNGATIDKIHSPITFSGLDIDKAKAQAQEATIKTKTNHVLTAGSSGPVTISSLSGYEGIYFVDGDLEIQGDLTDKSVLFVASGNIKITGDITVNNGMGDNKHPHDPQLGLFARKDVLISKEAQSDLKVNAFVVADGQGGEGGVFKVEQDPKEHGSNVGSKGKDSKLTFYGAISVRGNTSETAVTLNAYSERDYTYNTNLSKSNLGFFTSIANIISWQEINPKDPVQPSS